MNESERKRPWLAALLAVVPGLGHAYLGLWGRAFLWAAMAGLTATVFRPDEPVAGGLEGLAALGTSLSTTAVFMLAAVTAMAALDAYWHAVSGAADPAADGPSCPECGKAVDADLEFCQWCTAEFE